MRVFSENNMECKIAADEQSDEVIERHWNVVTNFESCRMTEECDRSESEKVADDQCIWS